MIIREISDKDINSLYKIGLQEFKGELWFTKRFLKETVKTPGYYYGAFERGKLLGGILVRKFDKPKLWIFFFAVDRGYRTKGIGGKLLKKIENKCSKTYPLIFVDICEALSEAKKFYVKCGFKRQAKVRDWFGINQEGLIYSKRLI
jgi:GNAT superfamily N-acetyltransferase